MSMTPQTSQAPMTPQTSQTPRLCIVVCLFACSCLATGHPRPAEIAKPGQLTFDGHVPLTTLGIGSLDGTAPDPDDPDGEPDEFRVGGPTIGLVEIVGTGPIPVWWELSGRMGVFPGCEVGIMLGIFRQGGEARCAVIDQREGMPVSMALGFAAAYQPFFGVGGPWYRGSLDISYRKAKELTLMFNLYASRGPEGRVLGGDVPEKHWDTPLDPELLHQTGSSVFVSRDEWRIATAIGAAVSIEGKIAATVGLVPYFIIDDQPIATFDCGNCSTVSATEYNERFGISLVVGFTRLLP